MDLVNLRHYFHAHPEISDQEKETAKEIVRQLKQCNPTSIVENIGGYGVMAIFDSQKPGEIVLLRCELDALPIREINDFEHRSVYEGVSHKCGHDGHMTTLLGVARKISCEPFPKGKVVLLFQPSEETSTGAEAVLSDAKFKAIKPDYAFAFHNLPGYPLNHIITKKGSFTAAVKSIIIKLQGKTSHAGEPEKGINPALAISEIIKKTLTLSNNQVDREDFAIVTPIHINMGEKAYGVSAGYGELHLTIRTWTEQQLDNLSNQILQIIHTSAEQHHLKSEIEWTQHFRATENNDMALEYLQNAIHTNGYSHKETDYPFKWGEDFGLFTQQYKGALFGIGSGTNCPALHNPDYDFPDEILPIGVELFYAIVSQILDS
ncbi:amidohydrolase [Marinilabiliaceae bacterium JC017]|nr:amidohydrolase [Marinilabiliaceae bacterium JC017]